MANRIDIERETEYKQNLEVLKQQDRINPPRVNDRGAWENQEEPNEDEEEKENQEEPNEENQLDRDDRPENPNEDDNVNALQRLRRIEQNAVKVEKVAEGVEAAEGAAATTSFLAATSEIWVPVGAALLAIALLIGFFFFIVTTAVAYCNAGGVTGMATNAVSNISWFVGNGDFCEELAINDAPSSGGAGGGGSFAGLEVTITSAYRAGSNGSAHQRGEAVDIALRNPTVAIGSNDPRIAQLAQLARNAGFVPPVGDTINEYANPTENTTGGHIHIEFNRRADGTTYCDNSTIRIPPTDLVSLPSGSYSAGTSDPRVRPCILDEVLSILQAASAINNTNNTSP